MGLIDKIASTALDKTGASHAMDQHLEGPVTELVQKLLDVGIDGMGPVDGAAAVATKASSGRSVDKAVKQVIKDHKKFAGAGGFVTGLGGFLTMPIALPANVVEFYLTGTRMVAAVAKLRGYDISTPETRSAILLTLVGADADDDLLQRAGVLATGRLSSLASQHLPASAVMMINKGVGFRLISTLGEKGLARFVGKGLPLVGGVVGGGMDYYLLGRLADNALKQFPPVTPAHA